MPGGKARDFPKPFTDPMEVMLYGMFPGSDKLLSPLPGFQIFSQPSGEPPVSKGFSLTIDLSGLGVTYSSQLYNKNLQAFQTF